MEKALVICTPGLEKELHRELQEVWPFLLSTQAKSQLAPFPEVQIIKGGIEVPCTLFQAVQLNFFLKLATRVLWRLAEFRVRDFPKLFQNLSKIQWGQWLKSSEIKWHITAAGSRLNNEKRIQDTAESVLAKAGLPAVDTISYDVFIRNFKDEMTVSLDLSGEPLYKRSLNKKIGEAPFRETWAQFLLRRMIKDTPLGEIEATDLIDPFCGSGTFLLEALTLRQPNWGRSYAFQNLLQAPKLFRSKGFEGNYFLPPQLSFHSLSGQDSDPEMIEAAQSNEGTLPPHKFAINWRVANSLIGETLPTSKRRWLIMNPPWGVRLPTAQSFESIALTLAQHWKPLKMAMVLPAESLDPSCISDNYRVGEKLSLSLGGKMVDLWIFEKINPDRVKNSL